MSGINATLREEQLEWIITQAPLMIAPDDSTLGSAVERLSKSATPYAYLHINTFNKITHNQFANEPAKPFYKIGKSPTKFVPTFLLPEGTIIFTPNRMPGVDGI